MSHLFGQPTAVYILERFWGRVPQISLRVVPRPCRMSSSSRQSDCLTTRSACAANDGTYSQLAFSKTAVVQNDMVHIMFTGLLTLWLNRFTYFTNMSWLPPRQTTCCNQGRTSSWWKSGKSTCHYTWGSRMIGLAGWALLLCAHG